MKPLLTAALVYAIAAPGIFTTDAYAAYPETAESYKIDPQHSSVTFKIRNFFTKVSGRFSNFEGTITVDRNNPANSSAEAVIYVSSIDTHNGKRDAHLRTDDFFDTENHPRILFKSSKWEATDEEDIFEVTGDLQMHGISQEVILRVQVLESGTGRPGADISRWEATTTLNRTDWDISGGRPAIGTKVKVIINVEAIRQ